MTETIHKLLTEEYALIHAVTPEHIQAIKDIRAEVFVSKLETSLAELEKRKFLYNKADEQSFIYLLQHVESKKYVATVRIIFINARTPIKQIPLQKEGKVQNIEHLTKELPICEISRMAMIKDLPDHDTLSKLQLGTNLALGLMSAVRINVMLYHYTNIFAIMEKSLHRILKRQGVKLEPIGEAVDYYGVRFPFVITKEAFIDAGKSTEDTMGRVTRFYLQELCKNPDSFLQFVDNNPYLERSDLQLDRICQLFKTHGSDVPTALLFGAEEPTPSASTL